MTLDFYVHKDDDAVECNIYCKQKYKDQIIKNQEKAEFWDNWQRFRDGTYEKKYNDEVSNALTHLKEIQEDAKNWNEIIPNKDIYTFINREELRNLKKLEERLKKLKIDTLAVLSDDSPNKEELQRVLNMINFALGEDGVKLTRIQCYHNHTKKVKDGIFCEDCQTQIQTYVLGEKRFGEEK